MFLTSKLRFGALLTVMLASTFLIGCKDIYEATLSNGMRVIVKEDHRSPVIASMIWYKVGSVDEPEGLTGISHVLEHVMFKGTKRLGPNEFSRIIAENGGRDNAFTSYDYTAYFQQLEKSRLPLSFELEADRMQNLLLDEEEIRKEIQVVMEERRLRTEDQPEALVYERFMNEAYQVHPYRHPIIGWMRDLEKITAEDLRDWYHRWYTPNNATLVVVGDVNPPQVVQLARKYFGDIPARVVERPNIPSEPLQEQIRRTKIATPAQVPYLLMGYHVPVLASSKKASKDRNDWEPDALAVLIGILDGGSSARFDRELIREQKVAASISTHYDAIARGSSVLMFGGTPASGKSIVDLERVLRIQIERIQREPVTEAELNRVKAQVIAREVYARDSVFYQAMQIGQFALTGLDLGMIDQRVARINSVTVEQVQAVAKKYLTENNLTVAVLDPLPLTSSKKRAGSRTEASHAH